MLINKILRFYVVISVMSLLLYLSLNKLLKSDFDLSSASFMSSIKISLIVSLGPTMIVGLLSFIGVNMKNQKQSK